MRSRNNCFIILYLIFFIALFPPLLSAFYQEFSPQEKEKINPALLALYKNDKTLSVQRAGEAITQEHVRQQPKEPERLFKGTDLSTKKLKSGRVKVLITTEGKDSELKALGAKVHSRIDNIAVTVIPLKNLPHLAKLENVKSIKASMRIKIPLRLNLEKPKTEPLY